MVTPELEQQMRDVVEREAIRDLAVRYCHYIRTRNMPAILDQFTEDAVFGMKSTIVEGGVRKGRKAIEETFKFGWEKVDPFPFVHNHVIDLLGPDRAKGYAYTEVRAGVEKYRTAQISEYEDEYVKEDGKWRFKSRMLNSVNL